MGKKQEVLIELFRKCQQRGDWSFDNDRVEAVCRRVGFKNKFDATKLDTSAFCLPSCANRIMQLSTKDAADTNS